MRYQRHYTPTKEEEEEVNREEEEEVNREEEEDEVLTMDEETTKARNVLRDGVTGV